MSINLSTILIEVFPSQYGGMLHFLYVPLRTVSRYFSIVAKSVHTRVFVPISHVMGLSVLSRIVRQGIPR